MKRKSSRYRRIAFPAPFVRPIEDRQPTSSPTEEPRRQGRKIFIITQVRRSATPTAAGGKTQRVLVFDNHPDSLRLLFGRLPDRHVDLSKPQRVSSWELILVSILTMSALIGMFWPIL
jgi:hypothetical protein